MIVEAVLIINSMDHTQTSKEVGLAGKKVLSGKRGGQEKVIKCN